MQPAGNSCLGVWDRLIWLIFSWMGIKIYHSKITLTYLYQYNCILKTQKGFKIFYWHSYYTLYLCTIYVLFECFFTLVWSYNFVKWYLCTILSYVMFVCYCMCIHVYCMFPQFCGLVWSYNSCQHDIYVLFKVILCLYATVCVYIACFPSFGGWIK